MNSPDESISGRRRVRSCTGCGKRTQAIGALCQPCMRATPFRRFWTKVNKNGSLILDTPCWEWTGCRHVRGYGKFRLGEARVYAHRTSWEIANGPIPPGMLVCHRCDNTPCVNPAHLFLGTDLDNQRDKMRKGRHTTMKLSDQQVREIRARGNEKATDLAKEFGVHSATILSIRRFKHRTKERHEF